MTTLKPPKSVIGLFEDEDTAAAALDAVASAGFEQKAYDILTGTPSPEAMSMMAVRSSCACGMTTPIGSIW